MIKVIYRVPVPYRLDDAVIEVYGDVDNATYEYRVRVGQDHIERDTSGLAQYGCAEIALRDALMCLTD